MSAFSHGCVGGPPPHCGLRIADSKTTHNGKKPCTCDPDCPCDRIADPSTIRNPQWGGGAASQVLRQGPNPKRSGEDRQAGTGEGILRRGRGGGREGSRGARRLGQLPCSWGCTLC